jgi:NAD(P)-dependent dehydrogenase (short-subunit alcohol dehydrogenase family)
MLDDRRSSRPLAYHSSGEEVAVEQLDGKVAVLTGAGSGIGRATSLALAAEGVRVVVSDVDAMRAELVAEEIRSTGGDAVGARCDVAHDLEFALLRARAMDVYGAIDIVMNNVGVLALGQPASIPLRAWHRMIELNLLSVVRSMNTFLTSLIEQGSGHVVNTASTAGLYAYSTERLPYSATKGAVVALTESLALYCKPRGVGVTLLCPGPVATNIVEQMEVHGEIGPLQAPELEVLDPAVVGRQVVAAIREDTYFVPTHEEVREILRRKAEDVDAFVDAQIEKLAGR